MDPAGRETDDSLGMLSPVTTNYRRSESKLRFAYFEDPRDAALWTSGQK